MDNIDHTRIAGPDAPAAALRPPAPHATSHRAEDATRSPWKTPFRHARRARRRASAFAVAGSAPTAARLRWSAGGAARFSLLLLLAPQETLLLGLRPCARQVAARGCGRSRVGRHRQAPHTLAWSPQLDCTPSQSAVADVAAATPPQDPPSAAGLPLRRPPAPCAGDRRRACMLVFASACRMRRPRAIVAARSLWAYFWPSFSPTGPAGAIAWGAQGPVIGIGVGGLMGHEAAPVLFSYCCALFFRAAPLWRPLLSCVLRGVGALNADCVAFWD